MLPNSMSQTFIKKPTRGEMIMQSAKQGGKKMLKGAKKGLKSTGEFLISDQGQYVV